MKKKNIELDVDFIGDQEPLTKEEEQAISNFIATRKIQILKKKSVRGGVRDKGTINILSQL